MLNIFNNYCYIIIILVLIYCIIKTLYNFNKPVNINKVIDKYNNQNKIKQKLLNSNIHNINLSHLLSYYFGII